MQALDLAPDNVEVRLAAYRFYFYNHRLAEALRQAASIVVHISRRLNVATDWHLVRPGTRRSPASRRRRASINQSISSCTYSPDRNPDELVWKHLRADTVGRMTITDKADFKAKVRASMCQLQNDPEKIRTKNWVFVKLSG